MSTKHAFCTTLNTNETSERICSVSKKHISLKFERFESTKKRGGHIVIIILVQNRKEQSLNINLQYQ